MVSISTKCLVHNSLANRMDNVPYSKYMVHHEQLGFLGTKNYMNPIDHNMPKYLP